jgi:hypothetical protein
MRYGFIATFLLFAAAITSAAEETPTPPNANDKIAIDALKEVHNLGASLYNAGDGAGCLRTYQAGLIAVKPFLAHRPAVQKKIEMALAAVGDKPENAKLSAFNLHLAIEEVRADLKTQPAAAPKKLFAASLKGSVTLDGKPVPNAAVTFRSVDQLVLEVLTAKTDANGVYIFAEPLPAGKYIMLVSGTTIPTKYAVAETSGLICVVAPGENRYDIKLAK